MKENEGVRFILNEGKGHSASFVYRPPNGDGEPLAVDAIPPHKHERVIWVVDDWVVNLRVNDGSLR